MVDAIYRISCEHADSVRLARGSVATGPTELLSSATRIDAILAGGGDELQRALEGPTGGPMPPSWRLLAPIESQEVWAAGVTYARSRNARKDESDWAGACYDAVYEAARPELFFKAAGWRVCGPADPIGVRRDSAWNVPEPELALVVSADGAIVGYTIGNDVSSRAIEGANPLYLPQAKVYDGSCALGPALVPASRALDPFEIRLRVWRDGALIVEEATSTAEMRRPFADLVTHLRGALTFPVGVVLMTGTGVVPEPPFTLLPGDTVEVSIPGLGALVNRAVAVGGGSP